MESGKERRIFSDPSNIDEVCWTRQNQIIFSSNKKGNFDLWMVPVTGGSAQQLTTSIEPEVGMAISADGKKLVYLQQQGVGHVWLANIDGSNLRQLTFDDVNIGRLSLSPDGNQIAFVMWDPDPAKKIRSIWLMDRNGSNRREITGGQGIARFPQFSPDGKFISFLSYADTETMDSQRVYLVQTINPGGSPTFVSKGQYFRWLDAVSFVVYDGHKSLQMTLGGNVEKQVYEDSTFAFPILNKKFILYFDFRRGRQAGWIVASTPEGVPIGKPKKIHDSDLVPPISPDGTCLLVNKNEGELLKISLPDGATKRIAGRFPGLRLVPFPPTLSFDGKEVVYVDSHIRARLVMIENPFK